MIYKKSWKYILYKDESSYCTFYNYYRPKAIKNFSNVKEGDIGGYLKYFNNLSQTGNSWIYDYALVRDDAKISENAAIFKYARVYDSAKVYGNARVSGHAHIHEHARVYGNAQVYGDARVFGYNQICGNNIIR